MRPRLQRRRRLVEPDVTVRADAEDLQVDPAGRGDLALVARALLRRVRRRAVQEVDALRRQVHATEEVRVHEAAKAAGMRRRNPDELVEVERRRRETDRPCPARHAPTARDRSATGVRPVGRPSTSAGVAAQRRGNTVGQRAGERRVRRERSKCAGGPGVRITQIDTSGSARRRALPGARATRRPPPARDRAAARVLLGTASGSRRCISSRSQGTARKIPPARMNGNGSSPRPRRLATLTPDDSSSSAAPRRMPDRGLVAFAERRLHAARERADRRRLQVALVDLVNQTLRLRNAEVLQEQRRQRRPRPALVGLAQDRAQARRGRSSSRSPRRRGRGPSRRRARPRSERCGRTRSIRCPR